MKDDEYMTTGDAARALGISSLELMRMSRKGIGPTRYQDDDGHFYLASEVWKLAFDEEWCEQVRSKNNLPDPDQQLQQTRDRYRRIPQG